MYYYGNHFSAASEQGINRFVHRSQHLTGMHDNPAATRFQSRREFDRLRFHDDGPLAANTTGLLSDSVSQVARAALPTWLGSSAPLLRPAREPSAAKPLPSAGVAWRPGTAPPSLDKRAQGCRTKPTHTNTLLHTEGTLTSRLTISMLDLGQNLVNLARLKHSL